MADKKGRRQFGSVRKLRSGRYQARYFGLDGLRRTAPYTFANKTDAYNWLSVRQSELLRGEWMAPERGRVKLGAYAKRWVKERPLAERTREKYQSLLRLHIAPILGDKGLDEITPETVRTWRKELETRGCGSPTMANAYRLLRAILWTAVEDERIRRNPCKIKGADRDDAPERPVASVDEVYALADAVPARFRALVLTAAFTGLRWGELAGLRREDVDLVVRKVRVGRSLKQLDSGHLVEGAPKSAAGRRRPSLPPFVVDDLRKHLDRFTGPAPSARVFTGAGGGALRRDNWHRESRWRESLAAASLPAHFHFHDLRHTGNQLAALSGASLKELMRRMGHSSVRAAMIYQHATDERDQEIAEALGVFVESQRARKSNGHSSQSSDPADWDAERATDPESWRAHGGHAAVPKQEAEGDGAEG